MLDRHVFRPTNGSSAVAKCNTVIGQTFPSVQRNLCLSPLSVLSKLKRAGRADYDVASEDVPCSLEHFIMRPCHPATRSSHREHSHAAPVLQTEQERLKLLVQRVAVPLHGAHFGAQEELLI